MEDHSFISGHYGHENNNNNNDNDPRAAPNPNLFPAAAANPMPIANPPGVLAAPGIAHMTATTLQLLAMGEDHVQVMDDLPEGVDHPQFPLWIPLRAGREIHGNDIFGDVVWARNWETVQLLATENAAETFATYNLVAKTIAAQRNALNTDPFMGSGGPLASHGPLTTTQEEDIADHSQFATSGLSSIHGDPELAMAARTPIWGEIAHHVAQGNIWLQTGVRSGLWLTPEGSPQPVDPRPMFVEDIFVHFDPAHLGAPMASLPFPSTPEEDRAAAAEMEELYVDWTGGEDFAGKEEWEESGRGGEGE